MLKRLIISCCFIALLFGRPRMAHQQNGKTNREQQKADSNPQPVPPTHVVVEPSPAIENLERKANDEKQAPEEKSVSPFARPEWVIVYIPAVYAFISGRTFKVTTEELYTHRPAGRRSKQNRWKINLRK